MKIEHKEFLTELAILLEKHKASVSWGCHWSSDLHGVTDQEMIIECNGSFILSVEGSCICAYDIKSELE